MSGEAATIRRESGVSRLEALSPDGLLGLVAGQRWFARTGHDPTGASLTDVVHADEVLELGLVDVAFADGGSALYVVALDADGKDALGDVPAVRRLLALCGVEAACADVYSPGLDQTNSTVVADDAFVLKLYRRIEDGPAVEAELLEALERASFTSTPRLRGKLDRRGATIAIVTDYVPALGDGWELASAGLVGGDPDWLPERAHRLGEVTGTMHAALAAALSPAPPEPAAIEALAAELNDELDRLQGSPISDRLEELRELLRDLAATAQAPELATRIHGDYHLAQVLWASREDWVVIDLEGEPTRSPAERRRRAFALRDVAGMTRSFDYAASVSRLVGGVDPPVGWQESCRSEFLAGWLATVDPGLVPATQTGAAALLELLELQKLLYELRYELAHRPEWTTIPIAGLAQVLARS